MHHHITARSFAAVVLIALVAGGAVHAAGFPFNGSFELVASGKPVGWDLAGSWFVRPDAASDGRNGITVFGDFGQQDAQMVTSGFLSASDEPLTLSFTYSSPTGNVACGLVFCDRLGNPLTTGAWECLPVAEMRTRYERQIDLPQSVEIPVKPTPVEAAPAAADAAPEATPATEAAPAPAVTPPAEATPAAPVTQQVSYAAVRLIFRVEQNGAQIKFDNVKLMHCDTLAMLPKAPTIKAEERPNLLANGTFAPGPDGRPRGWSPLQDEQHGLDQATVRPAATPQTSHLVLQSCGDLGAAWLAEPILLDGALPYRLTADISALELKNSRLRLFFQLVDPQDARSVWLQQEQEVEIGHEGPVELFLPRLWTDRGAVRAQVAVEARPGGEGAATVRSIALTPEPLSLSVRAAAVAGGFKRPSDVSLFIAAINNTYAGLKPKAMMQVTAADGSLVVGESRAILIGSRSAAYFPYKPKLTRDGEYKLRVTIVNAGKELGTTQYDFRVGPVSTAIAATGTH